MILGLEVFMLLTGATALILGRFPLRAGAVNTNMGGRIGGLVLMLPIPIAFSVGMSMAQESQGKRESHFDVWSRLVAVELAIVLGCLVVGYLIAMLTYNPFAESDARRRRKRERKLMRQLRRANARDLEDEEGEEDSGTRAWVPVVIVLGVLFLVVGVGVAVVVSMTGGGSGGAEGGQNIFGQGGGQPGQPQQPMPGAKMQEVVSKFGTWRVRSPVGFHVHGTVGLVPGGVKNSYGNLGEVWFHVYDYDVSLPANLTPAQLEEAADRIRREVFENRGMPPPSTNQPVKVAGFPGREVTGTAPGKLSRARLCVARGRFYLLHVFGPAAGVNSPESTAFLESLEIIPPGAPPNPSGQPKKN